MLKPKTTLEPVIKWSGSKRQVAPILSRFVPNAKRYIEPFLGGGAMLPFRNIRNAVANDIIPELIELWSAIKNEPEQTALEYKIRWERLQKEGYHVYYEIRDKFNQEKNPFDFLFLTRTCVNGLIRYNEKGNFNNSFHLTRPGINPKTLREIILIWNYYIKNVEFSNLDYQQILQDVMKDDFLFLDPPYGGTKGRYTKTEFDLQNFYNQLERLNFIGARWLLTFDGTAGNREYTYQLPKELYKHKIFVKTGNSPFTKMMRTTIDTVYESVYLNFNSAPELFCEFSKQANQEFALTGCFDVEN